MLRHRIPMYRVVVSSAILVAVIAVFTLGTYLIGRVVRTVSPLLVDYQCSPQPCWHEIYPGKTGFQEAQRLLQSDPRVKITAVTVQELCWTISAARLASCLSADTRGLVTLINLQIDSPLRLGEVFATLGQPLGIRLCHITTITVTSNRPLFMDVYFPGGSVVTSGYFHPFTVGQLTPDQPIDYIRITASKDAQRGIGNWQGFRWLGDQPNGGGC